MIKPILFGLIFVTNTAISEPESDAKHTQSGHSEFKKQVLSNIVEDVRGKHNFEFKINQNLNPYIFILHGDKNENFINKIEVYSKGDKLPLQIIKIIITASPYKNSKYFEAIDMNFDGYKDIRMLDWWGATGNKGYKVWLYNPTDKKFVYNKPLSELSCPSFNNKNKTIEEHSNGGHMGQIYTSRKLKFQGKKLICFESEKQDFVREKNHFIKTKSKLILDPQRTQ